MNFKWNLSWIGLLGKTRRENKAPVANLSKKMKEYRRSQDIYVDYDGTLVINQERIYTELQLKRAKEEFYKVSTNSGIVDSTTYSEASNDSYDAVTGRVNTVDEAGKIDTVIPVKVYGIIRGAHYEYEDLDEQLFLNKDAARAKCLAYVEERNSEHCSKDNYAEITEGYWQTDPYGMFIQMKEFTLS